MEYEDVEVGNYNDNDVIIDRDGYVLTNSMYDEYGNYIGTVFENND